MRLLCSLLMVAILAVSGLSQQSNESKEQSKPEAKKTASEKQPQQSQKPEEAQPKSTEPTPSQPQPKPGEDAKAEHYDMTEVAPVVTHHQIAVNGKSLKYTATTGRLPIKRGDGKIEAEMFFVAYSLDGQDLSKRPLTFAFNGGPGSATIWLHMGALGPKHVALTADGVLPAAPYRVEDNPYTLLDNSDLVMVDAIGTGFSRAENMDTSKKFW